MIKVRAFLDLGCKDLLRRAIRENVVLVIFFFLEKVVVSLSLYG